MFRLMRTSRGQSAIELAMLIVVVAAVIVAIQLYFKRGLEGRWKDASDQIGSQFTTAETYTIQTRQQSARDEAVGTAGEIAADNWQNSTIRGAMPTEMTPGGVGGKEAAYAGHEVTQTDYVTQSVGAGLIGTHGTFSSGQMSTKKLFDDD